ncbi:hypothetical protein GCM10010168_77810 [Actinoplanes ianthinogenes]|uniref:Uncharacterized protein n=1 Tax=Actinoplanes ianthinogenes TaxID=122358 RepID=A0ABM7LKR5_9ACTN|nr:hypothetical protein [Actinoplanes ianthinogenes]BCJ39763.1 hypothetical protein Aiant_04200 [Actinoplanes ianthinogenes]GGR47537.1 hypothetical protein GCM10010168_77810 [Actinoplanes ianthinogenes]
MSSMTGARYVVETAAERLAREQRAEWERYVQARGELEAVRAEAEAYRSVYGDRIAKVPAGRQARPKHSPAKIAATTGELRELARREREALRSAVSAASRSDVSGLLAAGPAAEAVSTTRTWDDSVLEKAPEPVRTTDGSAARRTEKRAARRKADAERAADLVSRLPAGAPAETRAACAAAAAEIAGGASEIRVRLLLTDLEKRVRDAQRDDEQVGRARRELLAVAAPLETVPGEEADRLRARIQRLIAERVLEVPDGLRAEADTVVDRADRARRRKAMANALRTKLTDLGYQVTEGFETRLAGDGVAYAGMGDGRGYGVKVLLDQDNPVVRTQVVRARSTHAGAADDAGAERKFCDDYDVLLRSMRKEGVEVADVARQEPGKRPVQAVADEFIPAKAAQARQHQHRERTL